MNWYYLTVFKVELLLTNMINYCQRLFGVRLSNQDSPHFIWQL